MRVRKQQHRSDLTNSLERDPAETRLPYMTTPMIGRDQERAAIMAMLQSGHTRLITLTGAGGVGKTRLAWEAASAFSAETGFGFRFVDLSTVRDATGVALKVAYAFGVKESSDLPIEALLATELRDWYGLLVLDSLEHLLEQATDLVSMLVRECPELTILATSRAPLHLSFEQVFPVSALEAPNNFTRMSAEEAMRYPALQLFALRSQAIDPSFTVNDVNAGAVTEICLRVDGMPLAIELAAAQTRLLGPREISDRLRWGLPSLATGPHDAPPRQRTMAGTVAWSYDLLTDDEQWLFRQLSVFSGGFTLDAVEAISDSAQRSREPLAVLARLVDQNLVGKEERATSGARFRMLEPVHEVAAEMLETAGEGAQAKERHARYFLLLVERQQCYWIKFLSNGWSLVLRIEEDHENLKLALEWFDQHGEVDELARLASALGDFWLLDGHYRVRRRWLERAEQATRGDASELRARVLIAVAAHLGWLGEYQRGIEQSERSLAIAHAVKSHHEIHFAAARSGILAGRLGRFGLAEQYQLDALEAAKWLGEYHWSTATISTIFGHLGNIALFKGEIDLAQQYFDRALEAQRQLGLEEGTTHLAASHPIAGLGDVARAREQLPAAFDRYQRTLVLAWNARDSRYIGIGLGGVAGSLAAAGRWQEAARLFGAVEAFHESAGLVFRETMDRQRALGLPEPWQRAGQPFGQEDHLRHAVLSLNPAPYAAIPDVETAARLWSEGKQDSLPNVIEDVARLSAPFPEPPGTSPADSAGLTRREIEVLRLICAGKSDREIGQELFITRRTAATHVSKTLQKLDVQSRAAAAAWAVRSGVCR
jgi:non-specific serine/threonine protein kinase